MAPQWAFEASGYAKIAVSGKPLMGVNRCWLRPLNRSWRAVCAAAKRNDRYRRSRSCSTTHASTGRSSTPRSPKRCGVAVVMAAIGGRVQRRTRTRHDVATRRTRHHPRSTSPRHPALERTPKPRNLSAINQIAAALLCNGFRDSAQTLRFSDLIIHACFSSESMISCRRSLVLGSTASTASWTLRMVLTVA